VNDQTDSQLLRAYADTRSEAAFAELVHRHVDFVYSAARRMVCDPHLAEDVTQGVFVALANSAAQLIERPVLSGWLHRTAQNIAAQTVRTIERRRAREKEAAAMNELPSADPAATWEHLAPHLDAALGELNEPDRDAVLLRYFERKSAREMAGLLGTSEDAAQKRVNRAVERLRDFFAQRGITIGAGGLVVVLSANAVQAAPAGLAIAISAAAALAGTTLATTATATATKVMTLNQFKLIAAAVIAALSISLALVLRQNASLRRAVTALRASAVAAARPPDAITPRGESGISGNELQRIRKEHLELLSLRGRVTQLARELQEGKAGAPPADLSPNPAAEPTETDSILFSVSLTNRVGVGQTLVVGGWSKDGMRGYLLATPAIRQGDNMPDGPQISITSQVVGAPESFWNEIGWGAARSDLRRSTLAGLLTPEQLDLLRKALQETKGAFVSNTSLAQRREGEYLGIGYSLADDQTSGMVMAIDLYPWLAGDGQSVDLEIRPSAVSTNTPIHPLLKPGNPSASPRAQ
jgi:RNA polymerase sigma factor (sigma-70 family)